MAFKRRPTVEHQVEYFGLFPDEDLSCDLCGLVDPSPDGCLCTVIGHHIAYRQNRLDRARRATFLGHLSDIRASQGMGFHWGEARRARGISPRGSPRELLKFIYGTLDRPAKKVKPLRQY